MNTISPIDRLLRSENIFQYDGNVEADARAARKMIDTFNRVNTIIQTPVKLNPKLNGILNETYQANMAVIAPAYRLNPEAGSAIDILV